MTDSSASAAPRAPLIAAATCAAVRAAVDTLAAAGADIRPVSVPRPRLVDGLPAGLMIVGPRHADGLCLRVARAYEAATGGFPAPPGGA